MIKISIAGRANTGKSTLFNALTHTRDALVHDRPGITRDIVEGRISKDVALFDTAGLENKTTDIGKVSTNMALDMISKSDGILFVVDGKTGLHQEDLSWAKIIRKANRPVLVLMNKAESKRGSEYLADFYKLGFGEPIPVSAEHKQGFDKIYDFIENMKPETNFESENETPDEILPLRISIMGQPNVGKSTLVNHILGQTRVIVMDKPGITRDTIKIASNYLGRDIILADTAGLRRKSGIKDDVETLSALKALDNMDKTDAILLIVDATKNIENQALGIASRVYDAGKILCIALNKWDLVPSEEREDKLLKLKHEFANSFHQIIKPLILPISAQTGSGIRNMMKRVFELWDISNIHAATSLINRTIEKLIAARQPPMSRLKRPMKIKFANQTDRHPIKITIHVGGASDIPESYTRYLRKGIAKALNWEQLPITIEYKKSENPFN